MKDYIAHYEVHASYFECMTLMPDSDPHKRTYSFKAKNNDGARKIAEDYKISS